jgi:hypothetical protein
VEKQTGKKASPIFYLLVFALWACMVSLSLGRLLSPIFASTGKLDKLFAITFISWLVLMWLGILLMLVSLLVAPFAMGTSFAAHQ